VRLALVGGRGAGLGVSVTALYRGRALRLRTAWDLDACPAAFRCRDGGRRCISTTAGAASSWLLIQCVF
jgi:hypothetical protein